MSSPTTNQIKVELFLEQGLEKPILEYFDPLLYLQSSPVFLTNEFISVVKKWYCEKIKYLNSIDIFFLKKLCVEAPIKNEILETCFEENFVLKKLKMFSFLYSGEEFSELTAVDYYTKYPSGRTSYEK